jgi:hypothetical protein
MQRYRLAAVILNGAMLTSAAAGAHAATFCINSSLGLAIALSVAQSNGEDDTINLEVGDYLLGGELKYIAAASETHRLSIIGGQVPGCGTYASSGSSVLDGQNAVRILTIAAKGEVDIGRLTFQHGHPSQYAGGALTLSNASAAPSYIFSSVFIANTDSSLAGAMYVYSTGDVHLWSNLVFANTGPTAMYLNISANAYVTGNTIVGNQFNTMAIGALRPTGSGTYYLSNNILWGNENADVSDESGLVDYAYNDIGVIANLSPHSASHELSVDPGFTGPFSVSLAPDSPLVNAGEDSPPGGPGGCCDPSGDRRIVGTHIDIGAYESDVLLRTGFQ